MPNSRTFLGELRHRNVLKVALAYLAIGWLLLELGWLLFPMLEIPDGLMTALLMLVIAGFLAALIVAWRFEMTPAGMKRTENISSTDVIPYWSKRKYGALIGGVAAVAALLRIFQLWRVWAR